MLDSLTLARSFSSNDKGLALQIVGSPTGLSSTHSGRRLQWLAGSLCKLHFHRPKRVVLVHRYRCKHFKPDSGWNSLQLELLRVDWRLVRRVRHRQLRNLRADSPCKRNPNGDTGISFCALRKTREYLCRDHKHTGVCFWVVSSNRWGHFTENI